MRFMSRETQFPGKRKLIKVDENNIPIAGESPILVNIVGDEGTVTTEGTPVNAENLNKGNWRDDRSVSFRTMDTDAIPDPKPNETQMVTRPNGETWIVPPSGTGGTAKAIIYPSGSEVYVGNERSDVRFRSDPQMQIDSKADLAEFDIASQALSSHIARADNPHNVTKSQVGLGNADNTSDTDKPISAAQRAALNAKANLTNGAMSDPVSLTAVSSIAAARALVTADNTSRSFSITNGGTGNVFSEASVGAMCRLTVIRTASAYMYELECQDGMRTKHASSSSSLDGNIMGEWVRPTAWMTVWSGSLSEGQSLPSSTLGLDVPGNYRMAYSPVMNSATTMFIHGYVDTHAPYVHNLAFSYVDDRRQNDAGGNWIRRTFCLWYNDPYDTWVVSTRGEDGLADIGMLLRIEREICI